MQVESAAFSVPGNPEHFVSAAPTRSPGAAVNAAEAKRSAQRTSDLSGASAQPQQFFLAVSPATPQSGAPQGLYLADTAGAARRVAEVASGTTVTGLHYHAAAQRLVCVTSDDTMTTFAEGEGGAWLVHSTMRFARRAPRGGEGPQGWLCTAWAGAPPLLRTPAAHLCELQSRA